MSDITNLFFRSLGNVLTDQSKFNKDETKLGMASIRMA